MGQSFWDKMPLWEKMCLVLALAIGAVMVFGIFNLVTTHRHLEKHRKKAVIMEKHRKEMERIGGKPIITPQRRPKLPRKTTKNAEKQPAEEENEEDEIEIPFGIRALEQGFLTPGIWLSTPTTPFPTQTIPGSPGGGMLMGPQTPRFTRHLNHNSTASNLSQMETPQPAYMRPQSSRLAYHSGRNSTSNLSHMEIPQPSSIGPQTPRFTHHSGHNSTASNLSHMEIPLPASVGPLTPRFTHHSDQNSTASNLSHMEIPLPASVGPLTPRFTHHSDQNSIASNLSHMEIPLPAFMGPQTPRFTHHSGHNSTASNLSHMEIRQPVFARPQTLKLTQHSDRNSTTSNMSPMEIPQPTMDYAGKSSTQR